MRISCVIPTYNNLALLTATLESVLSQTRKPNRVYVVDNASSDGTASIAGRFPEVEYLRLPENEGSAGGYFEGMKAALGGCDLLFLSDDDQVYRPDALEQLEKGLLSLGPGAGAVRCAWEGFTGTGPCEVPDSVWSGTLIRREVPERIGLPLKELFLYAEDVEYFWRMRRANYGLYVIPSAGYEARYSGHKARVGEPFGRTDVYRSAFRLYYAFRNEIYVYRSYRRLRTLRVLLYFLKVLPFMGVPGALAALDGIKDGLLGRLGKNAKYSVRR